MSHQHLLTLGRAFDSEEAFLLRERKDILNSLSPLNHNADRQSLRYRLMRVDHKLRTLRRKGVNQVPTHPCVLLANIQDRRVEGEREYVLQGDWERGNRAYFQFYEMWGDPAAFHSRLFSNEWNESDHPRDHAGMFTEKGGSNSSPQSSTKSNRLEARRSVKKSEPSAKSPPASSSSSDPTTVPDSEWKKRVPDPETRKKHRAHASLSKAVYEDDPEKEKEMLPEGWSRVSDEELREMGLNPEKFHNEKTGYQARVYKKADGSYVMAHRGTHELSDWDDNIIQGAGGESAQYEQAVEAAEMLEDALGGEAKIEHTGHSLGGGLASTAAMATGRKATTFNSAGVHRNTAKKHKFENKDSKQSVTAYYVKGEVLSVAQKTVETVHKIHQNLLYSTAPEIIRNRVKNVRMSNNPAPVALGTRVPLAPVPDPRHGTHTTGHGSRKKIKNNTADTVTRHYMSEVIPAMDQAEK